MDRVLIDLLRIERRLELEVRRATQPHTNVPEIPPGRLLCEMVHEAYALHVWENEGGAMR